MARPRKEYSLARVRLVNFHNFVNETVELRDGGHLFLLGDNGAGKTTILDAIHYALSGGEGLELNAAARVGGRRDQGRSEAGLVLRYDMERGPLNPGGAIAYAAVELAETDGAGHVTLGIGMEATSMDARVTKWGFLTRRRLEDVPLLVERDAAGAAPARRDELRASLGKNDVYFQLAEYRRQLAERLFGSDEAYEDVCRFWGMAKAYREIVAGARDFGTLFHRLLPAPSDEVFHEIVHSLKAIDELGQSLGALEEQRGYVAGLVEKQGEVAQHREAVLRYRWLLAHRERADIATERRANEAERAACGDELKRLAARRVAADDRVERAEEALRVLERDDPEALAGQLRLAAREVERLVRDLDVAADDARRAASKEHEAGVAAAAAREGLGAIAEATADAVERAHGRVASLPGDLPAVLAVVHELRDEARCWRAGEVPAADEGRDRGAAAMAEARGRRTVAERRLRDAQGAEALARAAVMHAEEECAELDRQADEVPGIPGFAAAARAVADRGRPLYELIEPRPEAAAEHLAAVEAMAGDDVLGAWVCSSGDTDVLVSVLREIAPAVRVVVATAAEAALPTWILDLFGPGESALEVTARAALATALHQPRSLGDIEAPAARALRHRGEVFGLRADVPRLLGAGARARALAGRRAEARARLTAATAALEAACTRLDDASHAVADVDELLARLGEVDGGPMTRRRAEVVAADADLHRRREEAERTRDHVTMLTGLQQEATAQLAILRARADEVGLEALEARLAELRGQVKRARDDAMELARASFATEHRRDELGARADALGVRDRELDTEMRTTGAHLRRMLPDLLGTADDAGLEHHVCVVQRGNQFRDVTTIRASLEAADRAAERCADELEGDGSRGTRYLPQAARFGFGYDRPMNALEDRRQQPAAAVLSQLDAEMAEQREVLSDRNRELMETLVMGSLASELQAQVEKLKSTIAAINRLLGDLRFGQSQYQFVVTERAERRELVDLVRRLSILDDESRQRFRAWIDERLEALGSTDDAGVPELLDYRTWFDYRLKMRTVSDDGVDLSKKEVRAVGSGGEQAVPNYLLVLSLARLMFDSAGARVRPLMFDEAFYGIDAGRRDQLLRFATDLGFQLIVASPDQDGATSAVRNATTLFVVKDAECDVHLAPYHYWNAARDSQAQLFAPPKAPDDAVCRIPG